MNLVPHLLVITSLSRGMALMALPAPQGTQVWAVQNILALAGWFAGHGCVHCSPWRDIQHKAGLAGADHAGCVQERATLCGTVRRGHLHQGEHAGVHAALWFAGRSALLHGPQRCRHQNLAAQGTSVASPI